jgi:hypothetical protein
MENLGLIMERLIDGDEGLLALDGIGPKGLAEIKTRIEAVAPAEEEEQEPDVLVELTEPAPVLEEEPAVIREEVVVTPLPVPSEVVSEAEVEIEIAEEVEPEVAEAPAAPPKLNEAQRRAAREKALARIPADAYDIPLPVLALSGQVSSNLRTARIENLGELMELLAEGDEALLALKGIDQKALDEIKTQVEIMVGVSLEEPEAEELVEPAQAPQRSGGRRYEYVLDEELEQAAKPKRQRRPKQRWLDYDDEQDESEVSGQAGILGFDEWDETEE